MSEKTKGHDMSAHWRLVSNEGGLITGTWWVTRPNEKGRQHVKPIDVVMWSEGRNHGLTLKLDDFTAFVASGVVEPIRVRAHHDHVEREAKARLGEIETAVLAVVAAAEWPKVGRPGVRMTINWDDVNGWGGRVHVAAWAPDRHADETEED